MAHAQKPDFVLRRNGRVHLNRRGRQFIRLLAAEVCASAVVMLDTPRSEVVWRLATHSIRQFPLHFPSRASPCAITFQLDSTCHARPLQSFHVTVLTGWNRVKCEHDTNFCCSNAVKCFKSFMPCAQQFTEALASSNIERFRLVVWENLALLWQSCQGMRLARTRQTERTGRDDMHARSPKAIEEIYDYVSPLSRAGLNNKIGHSKTPSAFYKAYKWTAWF